MSKMLITSLLLLACTPDPSMICTREYAPVCADNTEFTNRCLARAAGFRGDCEHSIVDGTCKTRGQLAPELPSGLTCAPTETYSETGKCVPKPWSDFASCAEEKRQGACPGGRDPNPWVGQHCSVTCAH